MQEKTCYLCWRRVGQEAVNLNCKEICVQKLKEASPRPVGVRVGALSAPQDPGSRAWKGVENSVQSNLALKQRLEEKCWLFCTVFQEAESQCRQEGSSGSMTLEELLSWHFSPAGRLCPGGFTGERGSYCSWNRTLPSAALLCLII